MHALEGVRLLDFGQYLAGPFGPMVIGDLGADVVGLANNHIYDYGTEGVERTLAALEARGLQGLGAGRTLSDDAEIGLLGGIEGAVAVWCSATRADRPATTTGVGVDIPSAERAVRAASAARASSSAARIPSRSVIPPPAAAASCSAARPVPR